MVAGRALGVKLLPSAPRKTPAGSMFGGHATGLG